jgi:tricarballylate dehydrogenase
VHNAAAEGCEVRSHHQDGKGTAGIDPQSNWAQPLDTLPYDAYATTCGITSPSGAAHRQGHRPGARRQLPSIDGLYTAGGLVGGLFYFNYPSGTGLRSGAVFGRPAGTAAGKAAS